jgi:hypothetical protein
VAWRRSGFARSQGLLELVRLAIAGLVAVLLNQPEWVEEQRRAEKPVIAVLHDASRSMDTRDVAVADAGGGGFVRPARGLAGAVGDRGARGVVHAR